MKGSIQTLPTGSSTGQIDGIDGVTYEFYLTDFSADDVATALEELESVEFEAVHGEINRAMRCVRLRAAPLKAGPEDIVETSSPAPDQEEGPRLYSPPTPAPLLCKGKLPPEWEILLLGDWRVSASSPVGTDEARRIIARRALELNANALLELEYHIDGAGGDGPKTHCFQGRLAIVGKADPQGKPREMLATDLNQAASAVSHRLELRRQSVLRQNYALYAICLVATLVAAGGTGMASWPTLIVGVVALAIGVKLSQPTTFVAYVEHSPVPPSSEASG